MISEIDIRDFPRRDDMITPEQAAQALGDMYVKAFEAGAVDSCSYFVLEQFIKEVGDAIKEQNKRIPFLLNNKP